MHRAAYRIKIDGQDVTSRFDPVLISLTITDSDVTSPQIVTLTGTGVQAAVSLSPTSRNFGTQARRTTSASFTFILSNPGTASLTMVGTNVGAGQIARARRVAWTAAFISAGATGLIGLCAAVSPARPTDKGLRGCSDRRCC